MTSTSWYDVCTTAFPAPCKQQGAQFQATVGEHQECVDQCMNGKPQIVFRKFEFFFAAMELFKHLFTPRGIYGLHHSPSANPLYKWITPRLHNFAWSGAPHNFAWSVAPFLQAGAQGGGEQPFPWRRGFAWRRGIVGQEKNQRKQGILCGEKKHGWTVQTTCRKTLQSPKRPKLRR